MKHSWEDVPALCGNVGQEVDTALGHGKGVLHLLQTWVHREFCNPGANLRLDPRDWYIHGPRKGIDERWFASTMPAKNTFSVPYEGLSFVLGPDGKRFTLADAVRVRGPQLVGQTMWDEYKQWYVYSKFFDNRYALPFHSHMDDKGARRVCLNGKPESYYFPWHYNQHWSVEPITFIGLRPGTTKEDVRLCLELWGTQGYDIRFLSQAYLMEPGTGWLMPAGTLHAPAGVCTFEPQSWSDTFQMYQARTTDGWLDRDVLLFRDVPDDKKGDFDYMVDLLDWETNLDPDFARKNHLLPVCDGVRSGPEVHRNWVVYGKIGGKELFSAAETTLQPGCKVTLSDKGASGILFMTGHGSIGGHRVEVPTMMRYYEIVWDEFFISARAANGVEIVNEGKSPMVYLQYYGPDTWGDELPDAPK